MRWSRLILSVPSYPLKLWEEASCARASMGFVLVM